MEADNYWRRWDFPSPVHFGAFTKRTRARLEWVRSVSKKVGACAGRLVSGALRKCGELR
jgi:hypothetical protein